MLFTYIVGVLFHHDVMLSHFNIRYHDVLCHRILLCHLFIVQYLKIKIHIYVYSNNMM